MFGAGEGPRSCGPTRRSLPTDGPSPLESRALMVPDRLAARYREIQEYVDWSTHDAENVQAAAPILRPHLHALVDDFYDSIQRSPNAARVFTGGDAQIQRLRGSLLRWLGDLLSGVYDRDYV